jgi:hypothetical protein
MKKQLSRYNRRSWTLNIDMDVALYIYEIEVEISIILLIHLKELQ